MGQDVIVVVRQPCAPFTFKAAVSEINTQPSGFTPSHSSRQYRFFISRSSVARATLHMRSYASAEPQSVIRQPSDSRRRPLGILAHVQLTATRRSVQHLLQPSTNAPSQLHIVDVPYVMGNCSTRAGFLPPFPPTSIWTIARTADRMVFCVSYERTSERHGRAA
ncbi:hypothetical protein BDW22DRAFT_718122 [Trametopsis cervina]|nr:hypothetical protein BDW22DRAFT_718122 [Trametopsis cervina]